MALSDKRWQIVTKSAFEWERNALNFIRERLPDEDPYCAWSNFDFLADDGRIYEVDLLVLVLGVSSWSRSRARPARWRATPTLGPGLPPKSAFTRLKTRSCSRTERPRRWLR